MKALKITRWPLVVGVVLATALAQGCHDGSPGTSPGGSDLLYLHVTMDEPTLQLRTQEHKQLHARVVTEEGAQVDYPLTWSSNDPSVAQVTADGVVTALAAGDVNLTAVVEGGNVYQGHKSCTAGSDHGHGHMRVQVILQVGSVRMEQERVQIATQQSLQLHCGVFCPQGTPLQREVVWSSTDPSIVTVDQKGTITGVAHGEAHIVAESEGKSDTTVVTVVPVAVSLEIDAAEARLVVGETLQLRATARDAGGQPVEREVVWYSLDESIAVVSSAGLVEGLAKGSTTLRAVAGNLEASVEVEVVNPVASVEIVPSHRTIKVGATTRLVALPRDAAGEALTGRAVRWYSREAVVATVSEDGEVTARRTGTAEIEATVEGVRGEATVVVTETAGSVVVHPPALTLYVGLSVRLEAITRGAAGELAPLPVQWTSSDPGVATVSGDGTVTAVAPGVTVVSASSGDVSGSSTVTVLAPPPAVVSIVITPAAIDVMEGEEAAYTAVALDEGGDAVPDAIFAATVSDPEVASLSGPRRLRGNKAGEAVLTVTSAEASATVPVRVHPRAITIEVAPASATLRQGESVQLTATFRDAGGSGVPGISITWSSSDAQVAVVSDGGLVTAVKAGAATITATGAGLNRTASVTVLAPVASLSLEPASVTVRIGDTAQLTAVPRDAAGGALSRAVAWASADQAVATVDGNGLVTGQAAGETTVTATSEGKSASASVVVQHGVGSIRFNNPDNQSVGQGHTVRLEVQTFNAGGDEIHGAPVTYTSSDESIATVSADGVLTALANGTVTITASSEGVTTTLTVVVSTVAVDRVEIVDPRDEPDRPLIVGMIFDFDARTFAADGTELFGREVLWSSSDEALATVDNNGFTTGVASGTVTITATSEGKSASVDVLVRGKSEGGGGGGGGGGGEEGSGNNLSVPVIFAEGIGLTGQPVAIDPGVRPSASETIEGTPAVDGGATFWDAGNVADCPSGSPTYFCQGGTNTWRAMWQDAAGGASVPAVIDWGDNLQSHTFNVRAPLRVETVLYGPGTLTGFNMPYAVGSQTSEVQGTDGSTAAMQPTVYSSSARLLVQKLNNATYNPATGQGTVTATAFDGAVYEAYGQNGPGYYKPEVNGAGKVIYGYSLVFKDLGISGPVAGWWRITFLLDGAAPQGRNVTLTGVQETSEGEPTLYQAHYQADRSWVDVYVAGDGSDVGTGPAIRFTNPADRSITVGQAITMVAEVLDEGGHVIPGAPVTWTSGTPSVATVSDAGVVTGVTPGASIITASSGELAVSLTVLVSEVPVDSVEIVDPRDDVDQPLVVNNSLDFDARTYAADGTELTDRHVAWSTGDASIATIDQNGMATGVADGTVTITATSELASASLALVVRGQGGGNGGGGTPGGGETGSGNNLSVPVLFAEGIGLTGQPVGTDTGLRPFAEETVVGTPAADGGAVFWDSGNGADCPTGAEQYFCQGGFNTWRAMWQDASGGGPVAVTADWGDNLESHTFNTHQPLRVEVTLYGPGTLTGFNMPYAVGGQGSEVFGTDGTTSAMQPTVYSSAPRLIVQKLDNATYDQASGTGTVVATVFDGAVYEAYGQDGPGFYRAEVNAAGKVIYGYQLSIQDLTLATDDHKYGWWRFTFALDAVAPWGRNVTLTGVTSPAEALYSARYAADRTWLDVYVERGGSGGGGGGGDN